MIVRVKTISELAELSDAVHDSWLDVDSIEFDKYVGKVRFRLHELLSLGTKGDAVLEVDNVTELHLVDTEKVGLYDVCWIEYIPDAKLLVFHTGVPLELEVRISGIDMTLS